jgi:hypothetical protein
MPAARLNYLVVYLGDSQVYGAGSKDIALSSPPPPGVNIEDKRILFVTYQPDNKILSVHPIPQDEVLNAELKERAPSKKKTVEDA